MQKPSIEALLKNPKDLESLVKSFFNLSHMEYIILVSLYQLMETDVDTLMEHTGKAWFRNKVTTGLNTLLKKELCTREMIKGEGKKFKFKYIYRPKPMEQLKAEIIQKLQEWVDIVVEQMNTFETHIMKVDTKEYQRQKEKRKKIKKEWFDKK